MPEAQVASLKPDEFIAADSSSVIQLSSPAERVGVKLCDQISQLSSAW